MSEPLEKDQLIQLAADWILENSPNARAANVEIGPTTPLLQEGLLDSLGLVDLLAFLEKTTGNEIDLFELDEDEIMTLEGLCRTATGAGQSQDAAPS